MLPNVSYGMPAVFALLLFLLPYGNFAQVFQEMYCARKEPSHRYPGGVPKQQGIVLKMHVGITRTEAKDLQIPTVGRIKDFLA